MTKYVCTLLKISVFYLNRTQTIGHTQAQIADASGVSLAYLIHLEKEKKTAVISKALRIASLLSMDIIGKERTA